MTMTTGRPIGSGTKLDAEARRRPDGSVETVSEQVLSRVTMGMSRYDAARSAGIDRSTILHWNEQGVKAHAKAATGAELTEGEHRYWRFLNDLEKAEAESELRDLAIITGAAQGGGVVTKRTVKTQNGVEVEEVVVTETLAPQWTAAAWRRERLQPSKYARLTKHEMSGPDQGPIPVEARISALARAAEAFLGEEPVDAEIVNDDEQLGIASPS